MKEGTLYPVLYRLEDSGLIESFWQNGEGRTAPKKYDTITEKGSETTEYRNLWMEFQNCISHICGEEINDRGSGKD
ncbi:MAG: PadR family transcriptional regulator [Blautia marasmi]